MELTNKDKQLLFLSTSFLHMYLEDHNDKRHKDIEKLIGTISKISVRYKDELNLQLEYAYKHLNKVTDGKDVECNVLILALGMAFMLAEHSSIDKPVAAKIFKVGMKIYTEVEKHQVGTESFRNANMLVDKFTATYGD